MPCFQQTRGGTLAVCYFETDVGEKLENKSAWLNHFFFSFLVLEIMNPVYSPGSSGVPYANAKGIGYPGKQVKLCFVTEL